MQLPGTLSHQRVYRAETTASHTTDAAPSLELDGERFLNIFESERTS